jgi:hypothetical protein
MAFWLESSNPPTSAVALSFALALALLPPVAWLVLWWLARRAVRYSPEAQRELSDLRFFSWSFGPIAWAWVVYRFGRSPLRSSL